MTEISRHPGRSPEFLSRLHDGDLPAAERAQFEAHRAHCAECRAAAAEFEAALALYRSSRTHPPPPDLSSRILRKLQAATPRRSPFGVTFGIDLRWAGAFAAALLAVIIGSAVVMQREAAERKLTREATPIPVVMEREKSAAAGKNTAAPIAPPEDASQSTLAGRLQPARPKIPARQEAGPVSSRREQAAAQPMAAPPSALEKDATLDREPEEQSAPARPRELKKNQVALPQIKSESPALSPPSPERAGGEGGSSHIAADSLTDHIRLDILPIDGAGPAPALLNEKQIAVSPELRGRVFELVIEAGGRVRQVRLTDARLKAMPQEGAARSDAALAEEKASDALKDLRFQPSDRPRILRVRVE